MKKPYGLTSPAERAAELQALLARVEAATGPDRELDAAICAALRYLPPDCPQAWAIGWEGEWRPGPGHVYLMTADGRAGASFKSAPLTASLDAALALVERVLPGWEIRATLHDPHVRVNNRSYTVDVGALGRNPALALLAAMLKALLAIEAQPSVCEQGEQGNPVEDEPIPHPDTREGEG